LSGPKTSKSPAAKIEGVTPILSVRSLQASIDYYVRVLGFEVDWLDPSIMASVSRDGGAIMLCEESQGNPGTWLWVGVDDADSLYNEYTAAGAKIGLPPTNYPWAYEFHVQAPDGHVLRFGSEPKTDQPFSPWVIWYRGPARAV
jgi:predicted enzyme related to lactoylglutathione lyase